MGKKRSKVLPFPARPTPPAPPTTAAEDEAKAKLAAEQDARAKRCMAELQGVLAKHRCSIVARTIIFYDGRAPTLEWDVGALA